MSEITAVQTDNAPAAIGPYSQAVVSDGWVFCSGQIPIDPATGELVEGDVAGQALKKLRKKQPEISCTDFNCTEFSCNKQATK